MGTFLTAALGAVAAQIILPVSWTTAAIIGAALAPTDPAVMFSVLARRHIGGRVPTILEGEAGANDPVAIALVLALADYATTGASPASAGRPTWCVEMVVGAAVGGFGAMLLVRAMRQNPLPREGLYAVRTLAIAGLIYGGATLLHGSGFLAVFVAGVSSATPGSRTRARSSVPGRPGLARRDRRLRALGLTIHLYDIGWSTLWLRPRARGSARRVRAAGGGAAVARGERLRRGEKGLIALTGFKGAVPILLAALGCSKACRTRS